MLKRIAAVTALLLALPAAPAHATHHVHGCGIAVVGDGTTTRAGWWTGLLYGFVKADAGEAVSIRCYLRVGGVAVPGSSTGTSVGTTVVATGTPVLYQAADPKSVQACAEWSAGTESGTSCTAPPGIWIAPDVPFLQEFWDLISMIDWPDFMVCPILASMSPGIPGAVDIDAQGDVVVLGNWLWDCPPYGS